jgi:drug/metabolite transporter (DMT)-like permease
MATAVIFLGEPLRLTNLLGATAVLVGVALTRTAPETAPAEPCEP